MDLSIKAKTNAKNCAMCGSFHHFSIPSTPTCLFLLKTHVQTCSCGIFKVPTFLFQTQNLCMSVLGLKSCRDTLTLSNFRSLSLSLWKMTLVTSVDFRPSFHANNWCMHASHLPVCQFHLCLRIALPVVPKCGQIVLNHPELINPATIQNNKVPRSCPEGPLLL